MASLSTSFATCALLFLAVGSPALAMEQKKWCPSQVCFALTGQNAEDFRVQQNIVQAALFGMYEHPGPKYFSAVQYSTSTTPISMLTDSRADFERGLWAAEANYGQSFVTGGLNYCFGSLFSPENRQREGRKTIVVLGSGRNDLGSDPALRANLFARLGGRVFAVGIGAGRDWEKLNAISGNPWRVLTVSPEHPAWQVGRSLADRICI